MSARETPVQDFGPEWCSRRVITFAGQSDTHIDEFADKHGELTPNPHPRAGQPYDTLSLAQVFTAQPGRADKASSPAFIPSTYHDFDARNHARQREAGEFVALTGDIDTGNHSLKDVHSRVSIMCREAAYLIYASAHSRPGDMRWRVVIPLDAPIDFDTWHDAQTAFFNYMERAGIDMDRALDRAGQPVYLPNVPAFHAKTGEPLRGEDGEPLYFERKTTGCNAPGLRIDIGPISSAIAEVLRKREDDERERERIRKEAEQRRANKPRSEGAPIIEDFNRENSIAQLFELYGYEQSPRHPEDWRSPNQTSESYATRIMGDKWVSLSGSDAGVGLGEKCKAGCFGDAYDLFVHFEHGGNHKDAFRTLYAERRTATTAHNLTPPPIDSEDPGWEEPPEGCDAEPVVEPEVSEPEPPAALDVVDAFDFEEASIPPRPWVIPGVMLSGYTHILAAPGGSGKSLFTLQLAITLARGEPWGSFVPRRKCRTLVINVEDDIDEQRRRLAAARRVMDAGNELRGMIDLVPAADSIVVAGHGPDGRTLRTMPIVETLVRFIEDRSIDVLIVDPFAETFDGDENDNSEVKWAMKIWRDEIARRTGCVVYLVHHTVKHAGNSAGDANVIRGGGAIVNSSRIASTLMPMTSEDAEMIGVDQSERHLYVRYDDAKANQSLKTNTARWFEKISVQLENGTEDAPGDEVGALRPWTPPDAFDGLTMHAIKIILDKVEEGLPDGTRYTFSPKGGAKDSGRWVGCLIMDEAEMKEGAAKKVIATWKTNRVLVEGEYKCPVRRRTAKGLFAPENARPRSPQ